MFKSFCCTLPALFTVSLILIGCSEKSPAPSAAKGHEEAGHEEHAHEHATVGPHGGDIVELGSEEYHAEIVHEGEATVYILDSSAKAPVAINAADVTINISHDGKAEQFKLAAKPAIGDGAGTSSQFTLADPELVADLSEGHAEVQLVVTINGKQYRGTLEHDHEEGAEHAH
jgi:hypothetical protein